MSVRDDVMSLPAEERLSYALELLEELLESKLEKQVWLKKNFNLTPMQAQLFLLLNKNSPRVVTKEAILRLIWGDSDVDCKIVDVLVCHIRRKGLSIATHWGVGYSVPKVIDVGENTKPSEVNRTKPWTAENDSDLISMLKSKSSLHVIAYELERTERGIKDRIKHLRSEGRLG